MIKNKVVRLSVAIVLFSLMLLSISPFIFQLYWERQTLTNIEFLKPIPSDPNETELLLYLNGIQKNDNDIIQVQIDELLNITVYYNDNETKQLLTGATVTLLGIDNLTETPSHYNITLNTNDLDLGINLFYIIAEKENYEAQNIHFFVELVNKETELLLYLNGERKKDGNKIKVEVNEFINITVYYKDNLTKQFLSGATVTLLGIDNLTETPSHYNITINTNNLDQGISILTIFAQLDNYQPQSIRFFVEVVERESQLQLFLNGINMTLDPVFEQTIGNILNITIKYTDNQTGFHITNAKVQLIGESLTFNLTENTDLGQYYLLLDTTVLGIGVRLFTIIAQATNYSVKTIDIRIIVNRIIGTISCEDGEPQREVYIGEDVLLNIILKDPQNNTIKNATVTYSWAYGQGELEDLNNDGIYNETLLNVPEGVHTITIYAFAGEFYTFEPYIITLIVINPPTFTLSSNAGTPDTDGSFILTWICPDGANNYSVYRYFRYITEINGSLTTLVEDIPDLSLDLSGYLDGTYYFIVATYSIYGEILSNCVKIDVVITKSLTIISPDSSSLWEINTIQYINWSSTGNISNVRIELYNNDAFVIEIISDTPNNGEFYWVISSGLADSKNYQLKIIYMSDYTIFDYSDYFEIKHSISASTGIPGYDITFLIGLIGILGVYLLRKNLLTKSR